MTKMLYRHDDAGHVVPTSVIPVLLYETLELNNTDILEYCIEHYDLPSPTRSLVEGLVKHIEGDVNVKITERGYKFILELMVDHVRRKTGTDIRHVLWLASRQSVEENYDGKYGIDGYPTSPIILSDLGYDGTLFAYPEKPQKITII